MSTVYAKQSAVIFQDSHPVNVSRGQAWDSDSDLVKKHPNLFEAEPSRVEGRRGVERATRAPGEKRAPGRPRKAGPADGAQ